MNLQQVKNEIKDLGKSPASEKVYPITSDWVPVTDVLAIVNRFEKHWRQQRKSDADAKFIDQILGNA